MATAAFAISVKYCNRPYSLKISGDLTVESAIHQSAAGLGITNSDDIASLQLVHQGTKLPKQQSLKDVLKGCNTTCCFLQSCSMVETSLNRSLIEDINNRREGEDKYLGLCSTCKLIVPVRPIYKCSTCKQTSFMMNRTVNLFNEDHGNIRGQCSSCDKEIKPDISYECAITIGTDSHDAMPLFELRENILKFPCMKCEIADLQIIKFVCGHTMCLGCFVSMCKMMLEVENGFRIKQGSCYTIFCPAGGENCSYSHIADPHHFQLVSADFYKEYKEKSINDFVEKEKCRKCRRDLDMTRGEATEVAPPIGATRTQQTPSQTGWGWYHALRSFLSRGPRAQQAVPRTRQQIECPTCQSKYCGDCKGHWHDGDCLQISKEQEKADSQFKIEPMKAEASLWK